MNEPKSQRRGRPIAACDRSIPRRCVCLGLNGSRTRRSSPLHAFSGSVGDPSLLQAKKKKGQWKKREAPSSTCITSVRPLFHFGRTESQTAPSVAAHGIHRHELLLLFWLACVVSSELELWFTQAGNYRAYSTASLVLAHRYVLFGTHWPHAHLTR